MKRTFSIFVSSVQKELAAERRALRDYLNHDPLLGRFFPDVFLFEDLPAQDQRPDSLYLAEIESRDIYLGIFGQKYGWKNTDGLSPTAREFRHATHDAKNKPKRLIFVKGQDDTGRPRDDRPDRRGRCTAHSPPFYRHIRAPAGSLRQPYRISRNARPASHSAL